MYYYLQVKICYSQASHCISKKFLFFALIDDAPFKLQSWCHCQFEILKSHRPLNLTVIRAHDSNCNWFMPKSNPDFISIFYRGRGSMVHWVHNTIQITNKEPFYLSSSNCFWIIIISVNFICNLLQLRFLEASWPILTW